MKSESPKLSAAHRDILERGSAIAAEVIAARGYLTARSLDELERCVNATGGEVTRWNERDDCEKERACFGVRYARDKWAGKVKERLTPGLIRYPCLVLPLWWSGEVVAHRFRPDTQVADTKYVALEGSRNRLDSSPVAWTLVTDPGVPLLITEGEKKSDALASQGAASLTVTGVWNWVTGKKGAPGTPVPEFGDVPLAGRDVHIVYDSDARRKPAVTMALADLTAFLWQSGAVVWWTLPPLPHKGCDDYLAAGGTLDGLLSGAVRADPRTVFTADPRSYKLLAESMRRQWALSEGRRRLEEGSAPTDDTWAPVDLAGLLGEDAAEPVQPDRLMRDDGAAVAYSGCALWLWGPPGSGKTFTALIWAGQEIREGRHVLWVDLESQARQTAEKLLAVLGCTAEQVREYFHLIQPGGPLTGPARAGVLALAGKHRVSLAVIDAMNDLITLQGANPNDVDSVARVDQQLLTPLKRGGASVVVIDHVTKNPAAEGWPVNSGHKKACADMGIEAKAVAAFTRSEPGFLKLTCFKDRNGTWQDGKVISYVVVAYGKAWLTMHPPTGVLNGLADMTAAACADDKPEAHRQARRLAILDLVSREPGKHTVSGAATALARKHHKAGEQDGMGRAVFMAQMKDMRDSAGAEITERDGKLYPPGEAQAPHEGTFTGESFDIRVTMNGHAGGTAVTIRQTGPGVTE